MDIFTIYIKNNLKRALLILMLLIPALASFPQSADTTVHSVVDFRPGLGYLGLASGRYHCVILDLQFISSQRYWIIKPFGGVWTSAYGNTMIYAGISIPIAFTPYLELDVGFAPGLYLKTFDLDLGSPVEFKSTIGLKYIFRNKNAAGIEFAHISNGGIGYYNPGTETLMFYFRLPLGFPKKQKK